MPENKKADEAVNDRTATTEPVGAPDSVVGSEDSTPANHVSATSASAEFADPGPNMDDTTPYDDAETAAAINDIASKESDDALANQDADTSQDVVGTQHHRRKWIGKLTRWFLVLLAVGGIVAVVVVPKVRYWILNTAGVRVGMSMIALDDATQSPLKGIELQIGGKKAATDSAGKAALSGLRLGPQTLTIEQAGYSTIQRQVVLGWGSNPLGSFLLKAVGVKYVIEVRDYLTGKPLAGVSAGNSDLSALSDKNGKISLTLASEAVGKEPVTFSKDGYRTDQIILGTDPKVLNKIAMVISRKTVYVTKQSGTYNVYKSDLDGRNPEILLPGTGSETSNISLVVSPDGNRAAYVSTRDNKRDADGFLLNSLTLINIATGQATTIAQASQIQLIDWVGTRLIFEQVSPEDATGNGYVVTSYSYTDNMRLQLVAASKLSAVQTAQGVVYYAVAADSGSQILPGLYKVGADGNGKQQVFKTEVVTVLRSDYNTLSLQITDGTWYSYSLANGASAQIATPSSLANRLYADNSNRTKSLWINHGALTLYDVAAGKDTVLQQQNAAVYPLAWLGDAALVYRVANGSETADYALGIDGGTAHKVADVAATYGFAHAQ